MITRALFLLVLAGSTATAAPNSVLGRTVPPLVLKDQLGVEHALRHPSAKVQVIVVTGLECPLANQYAGRLNDLAREFQPHAVSFCAVNANRQDSLAEIAAHVRDHNITFPYLKDPQQLSLELLGASRTPEVFVLDAQGTIRYHGRIDDQFIPGSARPAPTTHELKDALTDLVAGRKVATPETAPVGCLITRIAPPHPNATVTYADHIAPLLQKRCIECHRPGEIGPFSLLDYDEVVGWADMMVEVTQTQRMPPWHATAEFDHQFDAVRRLTAEELQLLKTWATTGMPAGDLSKVKPPQFAADGWQLPRTPDAVVAMDSKPFRVPATGEVKYQFFVVDSGLTEDHWVEAFEVRPGNRAVVHHVLVFATNEVRKIDGERNLLASYVPGLRQQPLPQGYAKRVPAGSKIVFQIHYTPNGLAQDDLTQVGVLFANPEKITHEVRTESVAGKRLVIQPMLDNQKFTSTTADAPHDLQLLSLSPHMHVRGKSFRYELTRVDGSKHTLLDVPAYDFNWQTTYRFREPFAVAKGDRLQAFAAYDNSANNLANPDPSATVRWGDQSWEEMFLGYFDIAVPRQNSQPAGKVMAAGLGLVEPQALARQLLKMLDKDRDSRIAKGETQGRYPELFQELDADQDDFVTEEELIRGQAAIRKALLRGSVRRQ